ncbi:hypothetical protein ACN2CC_18205 [Mesorhizobium muleiense]|uniref:hypothetical protein n=1 Tax=Mesorhizobium muleiense TaxID=1004279 RepID=UPI003AFAD2AB
MLFRYRVRLPRMQILDRRGAGAVALASTLPAAPYGATTISTVAADNVGFQAVAKLTLGVDMGREAAGHEEIPNQNARGGQAPTFIHTPPDNPRRRRSRTRAFWGQNITSWRPPTAEMDGKLPFGPTARTSTLRQEWTFRRKYSDDHLLSSSGLSAVRPASNQTLQHVQCQSALREARTEDRRVQDGLGHPLIFEGEVIFSGIGRTSQDVFGYPFLRSTK